MEKFKYSAILGELWYIVFRNVFLLTNGILFAVAVLLIFFGNIAGWFLFLVVFLNIVLGLAQDIRAWFALRKLQFLTAPKVIRLNKDGMRNYVLIEDIKKDDFIVLKIGDQVPFDGKLTEAHSFEINEGLITGESSSFMRKNGDNLLAGSVVTSGWGLMKVEKLFKETRIARMTEGVQKYSINISPIQKEVNDAIKYSIFALIAGIIFVVARGIIIGSSFVHVITLIGAITSMFVPQGLVFAMTLFFSYGAVHLFKKNVLLQEVNATEKLGRIKNLCMDKTGTLTKNELLVEDVHISKSFSVERGKFLAAAYIKGTDDSSLIIQAVKKYVGESFDGEIFEALSFSSWRGFGAVRTRDKKDEGVVFVGLPDRFLQFLKKSEREWLKEILSIHAPEGKRLLCVLWADKKDAPSDISNIAYGTKLSLVATFIFKDPLREGIKNAVDFFQNRGVKIRIISGDNAGTTSAVARAAGIKDFDKIVTGEDMRKWDEADFYEKIGKFSIFAGVVPEQKEKIINAFKNNGFTAMIGDGANDALAIKKADLGIAMFGGAPATRKLASVVLMDNSFAALPGGVRLADIIIRNAEIFSSLFLFQAFCGFFFFIMVSLLGLDYPLTPLNISFINYFTIGIPGILLSYWTLKPKGKDIPEDSRAFLKKILPFASWSAFFSACGIVAIHFLSPEYLRMAESNTLIVISFIALSFVFFICAPSVYGKTLIFRHKLQLSMLGILEIIFLIILFFRLPFLISFFTLTPFRADSIKWFEIVFILSIFIFIQYAISRLFIHYKNNFKLILEKI